MSTWKIMSARGGGALFMAAIVIMALAMILAQAYYPCGPNGCYNVLTNPISDLGNTVASPLWPLFDYALALFGVLVILGIFLLSASIFSGFGGRASGILLSISALAAIGVGVVPENTIPILHSLFSLMAFFFGGVGVLIIGIWLLFEKGFTAHSAYSILSAVVSLGALLVSFFPAFGILPIWKYYGPGFGYGGIERLVVFTLFAWVFITGALSAFGAPRIKK